MIGGVEGLGSSGRRVFVAVSAEFDIARDGFASAKAAIRVKQEASVDCGIISLADMMPAAHTGTLPRVGTD